MQNPAPSDLPAVIGPVQQRLPLPRPAERVADIAVGFHLLDVTSEGFPPIDLPRVVFHAATGIVPAVPLEPAARVVRVDPSLPLPFRKRLAGVDAEIVQPLIGMIARGQ